MRRLRSKLARIARGGVLTVALPAFIVSVTGCTVSDSRDDPPFENNNNRTNVESDEEANVPNPGPYGSSPQRRHAGSSIPPGRPVTGDRPGAKYSTDLDLTNVIGDWVRTSDVPRSAQFEYPERLEIRPGGVYLIPQAEIYEHAPLWQGGVIEAVEGEAGRVRLQSSNDAMLEYDWSLGDDNLTFMVEDDLALVYRRLGD